MFVASSTPRRCTAVFTLALLVLASSCGGDGGTNPNAPFGGDYFLKSVNGASLPRTLTISGGTIRLNGMRLSILQDGSYKETADYTQLTYTGELQTESLGTWYHDETTGTVALMEPTGRVWATGSSSGNVLSVTTRSDILPAEAWVYQR